MSYVPTFQAQLTWNWPLGALSCTCFAGAMAGEYDTLGHQTPTGKYVRTLTGDTSGGTTLNQVDSALRRGYGIDLDTRVGSAALTWDQFRHEINRGKAAVLQGGYNAIHGTKYSGSESFMGNHAITVLPGFVAMDPLADGRRPAIYKFHGAAYPESLLRQFASQLVIDPSTGRKSGLRVWCSLTRDNETTWRVNVTAPPGGTYPIYFYRIEGGLIVSRDLKRTQGIHQPCTAPRLYRVKPGVAIPPKSLVRINAGVHMGKYIQSKFATEYP